MITYSKKKNIIKYPKSKFGVADTRCNMCSCTMAQIVAKTQTDFERLPAEENSYSLYAYLKSIGISYRTIIMSESPINEKDVFNRWYIGDNASHGRHCVCPAGKKALIFLAASEHALFCWMISPELTWWKGTISFFSSSFMYLLKFRLHTLCSICNSK